jgi:hypothetical protein
VAGSAAAKTSDEDQQKQADKQGKQVELARIADEKRKAEEERKRLETAQLAEQAEEERKQEALRRAQEKKKKEQSRQQAQVERGCVIKSVMTDAEIMKCR